MLFMAGKGGSSCLDLLIWKSNFVRQKHAQITVFIIIAIVMIAGIAGYFLLKGQTQPEIPADFKQVEDYYLSCIKYHTEAGISMLEESGGYIYLPEFVPGSGYMPGSSQLNFLGAPIPYWYYVSGNNLVREQIPSRNDMEEQLNRYLEENLRCDFSDFESRGFLIDAGSDAGKIKANVNIASDRVSVDVRTNLKISLEDRSALISGHKQEVLSNLGRFYSSALKIYNAEKEKMFLENYALDVMYLYAPVDGVELTCSPKIWMLDNVKDELKSALEANTIMLLDKGNSQISAKRKYFDVGVGTGDNVRFMYSKSWPTKIETQDKDGVLLAEPVGNQPGMGILGFCYVPYHFVYDIVYPVLIQVYDDNEIFQFPVSVIIQGNKARNALPGTYIGEREAEICKYKNADVSVYTYNTNLDSVEAEIDFKCFNERCSIGKTKLQGASAVLNGKFPQCVNGFILAKAEGYEIKKHQISTNTESTANIILDKLYDIDLSLKINGRDIKDMAVISFDSDDTGTLIAWPEQKKVKLTEGLYNVSVYVYSNASIFIPGTKTQKCVDVPKPGIFGFFGANEEKCFDLEIPSQTLSNVIIGGGQAEQYITETELQKGRAEISASSLPIPKSIEDLQKNYEALEGKKVYMDFKS